MRPCLGQGRAACSAQLALKFADADAFGFQWGAQPHHPHRHRQSRRAHRRRGDQAVRRVADHLAHRLRQLRHAVPPQRRGAAHPSGARAAHRHSRRRLRCGSADLGAKGRYEFLQGSLADLDRLPCFASLTSRRHHVPSMTHPEGGRNVTLFHLALEQAPHVDDFDALLDVVRTATSIVKGRCRTLKWSRRQARLALEKEGPQPGWAWASHCDRQCHVRRAYPKGRTHRLLYSDLRCHHRGRDFVLTKAMAATMGWRLQEVERGTGCPGEARLHLLHPSGGNGPHDPPIYTWKLRGAIGTPNKK